jgi:hypothetical protein
MFILLNTIQCHKLGNNDFSHAGASLSDVTDCFSPRSIPCDGTCEKGHFSQIEEAIKRRADLYIQEGVKMIDLTAERNLVEGLRNPRPARSTNESSQIVKILSQ